MIKRLKAKIAYHLINFDEPEYAFDHFVQPPDESPAIVPIDIVHRIVLADTVVTWRIWNGRHVCKESRIGRKNRPYGFCSDYLVTMYSFATLYPRDIPGAI